MSGEMERKVGQTLHLTLSSAQPLDTHLQLEVIALLDNVSSSYH
jgi:hypothetical protein